jgi:hypothetical protein
MAQQALNQQISALIDINPGRDRELPIIVRGAQSGLRFIGFAQTTEDAEIIGHLSGFSFAKVSRAVIKSTGQQFFTLH